MSDDLPPTEPVRPVDGMGVYCHNCQAPLEPAAHFCARCGAPRLGEAAVTETRVMATPVRSERVVEEEEELAPPVAYVRPDTMWSGPVIAILIAIGVVIVLLIVLLAVNSGDDNNEDTTTTAPVPLATTIATLAPATLPPSPTVVITVPATSPPTSPPTTAAPATTVATTPTTAAP